MRWHEAPNPIGLWTDSLGQPRRKLHTLVNDCYGILTPFPLTTILLYRALLRTLLVAGLINWAEGALHFTGVQAQCLPAAACAPGNALAGNLIFGMGIYRVTLAGLDTTTNGASDGYQDYACRARTAQLVRGATYTLGVRTNPNADEAVRAWIDFDRNGAFSAAELVAAPAPGRQHQASFTVPASAPVGVALRLRIAADYANAPIPTACSSPQYSQTEDYRVVVLATPAPRPTVRFSAADTVSCSGTVAFRDESINAPSTWRWDFGDGASSNQQNPQHTYAPGTYTVRLRACNTTGCDSLAKSRYVRVRADAPRPASCLPATVSYCCNYGVTRVRLANVDHGSADGRVGYEDFSCAQRATLTADRPYQLQLSTGLNQHDVRVYVDLNDDGLLDATTERLYQGLAVLNPSVMLQLTSATAGLVFNRPLRLRIWTSAVGGGFAGPCTAPQNGQVEDYSVVVVPNAAPPTAAFALAYQQLCGPVVLAATNQSSGGATSYRWHYGDGAVSVLAAPLAHTYAAAGVYNMTLVATNAFGSDTARRTVAVAGNCPGYCVAEGRGGSQGSPAYFTRVQVGTLDNADVRQPGVGYRDFTARYAELRQGQSYPIRIESPAWSFAGNGPWARVTGWIDYNQNGVFEASERLGRFTRFSPLTFALTVPLRAIPGATRLRLQICNDNEYWSAESCPPDYFNVSTEDYTVIILPAAVAPRAGFTVDLTPVCTGTVQVRDTSWAAPTAWQWTFGDGSTSTLQHPRHTYAAAGTYTVGLEARNAYGTSSVSRVGYVTVGTAAPAPAPAACVPPIGGSTGSGRGIATCAVGSFLYTGSINDAGYRDETCSRGPLQLTRGAAYPVRVTAFTTGTVPANQVFIWLDANDDGRFDRLTELVFSSLGQDAHLNPKIGSLTVPVATLLNRPLRLRVAWDGDAPSAVPEACYRQSFSQVRDFTLIATATTTATTGSFGTVPVLDVYPNPVEGNQLFLTVPTLARNAVTVLLLDNLGRLVQKSAVHLDSSGEGSVILSGFPAGIYLLRINGYLFTRRITVPWQLGR